ncbi:unnamed protein product [Plutella xylostella]|uniref:(diamondback moth) hypothetical protein n=1 Tax=Plutella xylostella TaxID=51655 RepID=A0A8S4DBH0_PLUXY|nr:unnamed protein product [Plutella xylostella]
MNSPGTRSSPTYKNLKIRNKQSPIEIKEKLRKSYREKVNSCRSLLINSFRGAAIENEVKITLNEIYKKTFNFDEDISSVEDEQMLDEIRKELVKEELDWWLEEYERCQNYNIDWSSIEAESVICPSGPDKISLLSTATSSRKQTVGKTFQLTSLYNFAYHTT